MEVYIGQYPNATEIKDAGDDKHMTLDRKHTAATHAARAAKSIRTASHAPTSPEEVRKACRAYENCRHSKHGYSNKDRPKPTE